MSLSPDKSEDESDCDKSIYTEQNDQTKDDKKVLL